MLLMRRPIKLIAPQGPAGESAASSASTALKNEEASKKALHLESNLRHPEGHSDRLRESWGETKKMSVEGLLAELKETKSALAKARAKVVGANKLKAQLAKEKAKASGLKDQLATARKRLEARKKAAVQRDIWALSAPTPLPCWLKYCGMVASTSNAQRSFAMHLLAFCTAFTRSS